ncbi:MAG: hypothetical protein IKP86_06880 [Anaerolineaceae bacterium]|nr:hypothetical protein [Anaerolineaceae bacterium]
MTAIMTQQLPVHAGADRSLIPCGSKNHGVPFDIKAADLPDESLDDFSNAPFEFEETALLVKEDLQRLYFHAGTANRFSEKYLKYMVQLEQFIKQAGSCCLTKSVLEQKGLSFPQLEDLNIMDLVRMVSFHIRKCHAAIDGLYRDNSKLGSVYLQWELRWISLGERLKATDMKIRRIREGKIIADDLIEREEPFRGKPQTNGTSSGIPKSIHLNPHALPLDHSMAKEMLRLEKIEKKKLALQRREEERWERAAMAAGFAPKPFKPLTPKEMGREILRQEKELTHEPVPEKADSTRKKKGTETLTEAEARQYLIDKAQKEGDTDTAAQIRREESPEFYERWQQYVKKTEEENFRNAAGRAGPSADKRKKLREKRKKKR